MKNMTRIICSFLAAVVLLSLTACGGNNSDNPVQDNSPGADADQPAAAAGSTTLHGTTPTTPETLDPARGTGENDRILYVNLYECLVVPNENDGSPEPLLAESWEVSDDGLTYTFKLRQDVKFSDGRAMTAEDVKYSFDRMMAMGEGYAYILMDILTETAVIDEYTVEFRLNKTFGPFITSLTCFRILNSALMKENTQSDGMYGENGDYGTNYLLTNSAGSGPYVISKFVVHDTIVMAKNENYWGELPDAAPDIVEMEELTESATTRMLMNSGELDFVHGHQDTTTIAALTASDNLKAVLLSDAGLNYFMINTKKAPTDDVHIRKALSYACDYEQMREILGGASEADGPIPKGVYGYQSTFEAYTYNMDKAREEIAQSAYANSLSSYPIQMDYIEGNGDTGKLVYLLATSLESLGFTVTINETPWVQFCNNEVDVETSPHVTNLFCTANYPEAGALLEYKYASWTTGNWNQNEWLQDEDYDAMLLEALATIDDDKRIELYGEMQRYLVEDVCPSIYTCASVVMPVYNDDSFEWRGSTGNIHAALEYNYYFAGFRMK